MTSTVSPRRPRIAAHASIVTLAVLAAVALSCGVAEAAPLAAQPSILASTNPFDGVTPNFDVFGIEFNNAWRKALGAFWAFAFVVAGFASVAAVFKFLMARKNGYAQQMGDSRTELIWSVSGFGVLTALPLLAGAFIAVAS